MRLTDLIRGFRLIMRMVILLPNNADLLRFCGCMWGGGGEEKEEKMLAQTDDGEDEKEVDQMGVEYKRVTLD